MVEKGQGVKTYNNDSKYKYANNLEGFLTDGEIRGITNLYITLTYRIGAM